MESPNDLAAPDANVEQTRADFYAVIASLLLQPPSQELLHELASADALCHAAPENSRLATSWEKLGMVASLMDAQAVREEHDALFAGAATPRLNPYASFYLCGFLMEKPLAALRRDLGMLALGRSQTSRELEDHFGALCETARLQIEQGRPLALQKRFLATHLFPWVGRFTSDLRAQPDARFYGVLADFIDAFIEIEMQAFEMEESGESA